MKGTRSSKDQGAASKWPEKIASASHEEGQMPEKQLSLRFTEGDRARRRIMPANIRREKGRSRRSWRA